LQRNIVSGKRDFGHVLVVLLQESARGFARVQDRALSAADAVLDTGFVEDGFPKALVASLAKALAVFVGDEV
jgi:hypothetical protein